MALQHTRLTQVVQLAAAVASIYANPASTKSHVRGFLLHNTNTTAENVSVYWVPDAAGAVGTATIAMRILYVAVAVNETLFVESPYGLVLLNTNETIQAFSTTASKVNVCVLGDKE